MAEFVRAVGANAAAVGARTATARRLSLVIFMLNEFNIYLRMVDGFSNDSRVQYLPPSPIEWSKRLLRKSREVSCPLIDR